MTDYTTQRKLTAILSADVKGYCKLMGEDDESTVNTITAYRKIISYLIQKHHGRVVDTPGDNILAEFSGALNAVNSAIDIQQRLEIENGKLPSNRRMDFRIGINLGDVLHEDGRLYGDGVNVAARIECLADPGGISISRSVFDQVKKNVRQGFEYLGEHKVKNILEPVRIYRILLAQEDEGKLIGEPFRPTQKGKKTYTFAAAMILICSAAILWVFFPPAPEKKPLSKEKMAYSLPDKPSIAVLPFINMSGNPKQEYFSDGITEEIISALCKTSKLFVIARTSSFKYKGKEVDVRTVGRDLGVRYVLEGSIRKSGDTVRITAQLLDAKSGNHVWAQRYDRDLKDIFAIQDDITIKIITALQVKLTEGEQARIFAKEAKNLDVYLKLMEGRSLWVEGTRENLIRFGQIAQDIINMAPESAIGYRMLAWYYWAHARWGMSPQESMAKSFDLAKKALDIDESNPLSHDLMGQIYLMTRKYEEAIAEGERSVELAPNGAMSHGLLGMSLSYAGRPDEAIKELNFGIRLNPFAPYWYYLRLGQSYMQKGEYEKALKECRKALQRAPKAMDAHANLAALYVLLGRQEEARAELNKVLELNPSFSMKQAEKAAPFKNQAFHRLIFDALQKAGLK